VTKSRNTVRSFRAKGLAQRVFHVARLLDPHADVAVSLGQHHEVWQRLEVGHGVALLIEEFLPLPHHAEIAVVQVHDLTGLVLLHGRQFLRHHLDAAVAGDAGHVLIGKGELGAHRRRRPKPMVPSPPELIHWRGRSK
jgi:hypothetical protein